MLDSRAGVPPLASPFEENAMFDSASRIASAICLVVTFALVEGCGGGGGGAPAGTIVTTPTAAPVNVQGQWQIVAHSNVNPSSSLLIEVNLSQTGSNVSADTSNVVLIGGTPGAFN